MKVGFWMKIWKERLECVCEWMKKETIFAGQVFMNGMYINEFVNEK